MLHGYQIDNVVFIIEGLKGGRTMDELLKTADPLGYFPELKNIMPVEDNDYASLYQTVLIDLPVGTYFRKFMNEITAGGAAADENVEMDSRFIADAMKDYNLQQIQLRVKKIWLHEFYDWCEVNLNETSAEVMMDLLKFEADMMTIQIIANSLSFRDLSDAKGREVERKKYISRVGYLYPSRDDLLSKVNDFKAMMIALEATPYEEMLRKVN